MHVVQRQHEQHAITARPLPCLDESGHLRFDVAVGGDDTSRPARGAAGVDHQCGARRLNLRQWRLAGRHAFRHGEKPPPTLRGDRTTSGFAGACSDDDGRIGVTDRVLQLRPWMGKSEWHRDPARSPDSPLDADMVEAGRHVETDSGLGEVARSVEQPRRDSRRNIEEVPIRILPAGIDDGDLIREAASTLDDSGGW